MIENIILSANNAATAHTEFWNLVNDKYTVLAVLGTGPDQNNALLNCSAYVNNGSDESQSVRCMSIPNPALVLSDLQLLGINPAITIDWNNYSNYLIFSISNQFNNVGQILTAAQYNPHPATWLGNLVLQAQAVDQQL